MKIFLHLINNDPANYEAIIQLGSSVADKNKLIVKQGSVDWTTEKINLWLINVATQVTDDPLTLEIINNFDDKQQDPTFLYLEKLLRTFITEVNKRLQLEQPSYQIY